MKAIETVYNGYKFRSRLEARWAVFFDALGVEYEYEPEGFVLPSGKSYLPDFKVKCNGKRGHFDPWLSFDLYVEVKGVMTEADAQKIIEFSKDKPIIVVGNIPKKGAAFDAFALKAYDRMVGGMEIFPFNYCHIDGDYYAAYPATRGRGKFYLLGDDSSQLYDEATRLNVEDAYDKARKARFEWGDRHARD